MSNAKLGMISKLAGKALLVTAVAMHAMPAVADEAASAAVASSATGRKPGSRAATGCGTPAAQAAKQKQFDEIQETRISDPRRTVGLVHAALLNRCMDSWKNILLRIGVAAACGERMQEDVRIFFEKSNRDPALIQACPEYLSDDTKKSATELRP